MRRRPRPRYTLAIGDLSIDQVLAIGNACAKESPGLAAKVKAAVETVWLAYKSAERYEQLWTERFLNKKALQYARKKATGPQRIKPTRPAATSENSENC